MNVDIYDIRECVQVIAPDRINDLRAREHAAGMSHQVLQQGKLFGRQFDDTTGTTRFVPHEVERQIAHRELEGLIKTTVAAPEEGVNARQQFLHSEGLGQVVISPHVETGHTILDCTARCEHQYWRHDMLSSHLAADLKPIKSRQHHIKDHYIIGIAQSKIKTGVPIMREINGVALFQQDATQQKRQALLVLYHKDMHCSIPFFLLGCRVVGQHLSSTIPHNAWPCYFGFSASDAACRLLHDGRSLPHRAIIFHQLPKCRSCPLCYLLSKGSIYHLLCHEHPPLLLVTLHS